ncbi:MAG: hypothetical protein R3C59_08130 [Planctomycetaceae bacterium]
MILTATDTLIRYVEIWVPDQGASRLNRAACRVVGGPQLAESERRNCGGARSVAAGEGLAGRAWHQKSATILQEDPSELLDRISLECGASLAAVVAIPIFRQHEICGVVVLGLGAGFGGAEIWNRDDRDELAVSVAYYSGLPSFEFITRYTRFPKGAGIPGQVWESGVPRLLRNVNGSDGFMRSFGNDPAGISEVIGLPIGSSHGFADSVLLLLSSQQTPLAGHMELLNDSLSNTDWQKSLTQHVASGQAPVLCCNSEVSLPHGAEFAVALPMYRNADPVGTLCFLF